MFCIRRQTFYVEANFRRTINSIKDLELHGNKCKGPGVTDASVTATCSSICLEISSKTPALVCYKIFKQLKVYWPVVQGKKCRVY